MTIPEQPKQRAGALLYQQILKTFVGHQEMAERDMCEAAWAFADSVDPDDRSKYWSAKARFNAWSVAVESLQRNAGDWMRLDFPEVR